MKDGGSAGGGICKTRLGELEIEELRIQENINIIIIIFVRDLFQRNLTVTAVCRLPSSFQDDDD